MRTGPVATTVLTVCLAGLLTPACSSGGGDAAETTAASPSTVTPTTVAPTTVATDDGGDDTTDDAWECPATAEVEALLGREVDRQATGGGVSSSDLSGASLSYSYEGCAYELEGSGDGGDTDGEVAVTRITTHDVEGSVFEAIDASLAADFVEEGFEPVADLGLDAYRSGTELAILVDDQMVVVETRDADGQPDADLARALAEAVLSEGGGLLAGPTLDCEEIGTFAPPAFGTLDDTSPVSSTVVVEAVTLRLDGCALDFADGAEASVEVGPADPWDAWVEANQASAFIASYEALEVGGHRAVDDGDTLVVDDRDQPLRITTEGDDLTGDQAGLRRRLAELALG